jgi:hypothetical protein
MDRISQLKQDAEDLINQGLNLASTSAGAISDELYNHSQTVQSILNNILGSTGVVSEEQLNSLDEALRIQKLKLLAFRSEETKKKFLTYGGIALIFIAGIWYLASAKSISE